MLTVTPEATTWITKQLNDAGAPDGSVVRLFVQEGQIGMGVAEPMDEDERFEKDGEVYLAVGPQAAEALADKALCCQETEQGQSLAIAQVPSEEAPKG